MMYLLRLTPTDLVVDTSPGRLYCIRDSEISSPEDFSFLGVPTHLSPIALWNRHEIVSVTVNLNKLNISRHFADAISAPKSVGYPTHCLRVVTCRKVVIHDIPYA